MRSDRLGLIAGITALIALVVAVYLPTARLWPWGTDAERWLERGDPARPGWAAWVFETRHFVGYRPVAALSYAADALWIRYPPDSHWIDLGAMAAVIAGVVLLGRALVRPWSSPWRATAAGLLAGAIVAFHPVLQEVVPYLPRRSYELAEGFGLLGAWCFVEGLRRAPATWLLGGWALPASLAMFLACGSNEAIFPLVLLLPVLGVEAARAAGAPTATGLRGALLPLIPPSALVVMRNFVLPDDNLTGYVKKWFAYADGHNRLRVLEAPEPWSVFSAAWSYVLFPSSPLGDLPVFAGLLAPVAVALGIALAARVIADPLVGRRDRARRLPLWLALWGAATAALYALANTWFWREGFPLSIPVALCLGAIAAADLAPGRGRLRPLATAVGLCLLLVSIGRWSPVFGLALDPLGEELRATRALLAVQAATAAPQRPVVVWMVPQGDPDFSRDLTRAANALARGTGTTFRALGWTSRAAATAGRTTARVAEGAVVLPDGGRIDDGVARVLRLPKGVTRVELTALAAAVPRPGELWWWEGREMLTLRKATLPSPPAPAPPVAPTPLPPRR
jgi:hypothetical protein